ncbi:proteinase inhibitor [Geobacillus sp. CAMR12739]|nr:proteinase inhibitor [Geobacillus sp. CAMR12739]
MYTNGSDRPQAKDDLLGPAPAGKPAPAGGKGIIAGTLEPSLTYEKQNGAYVFTFTVKNQTERVQTITFTSGKKYDYILYRGKKKVKQFSEGKMFTQIYEERTLKQGEELSFQETFRGLKPGTYTLEWWLADKHWPTARAKATFTVE